MNVSINYSFKNAVRNKYINHIINNNNDINHFKLSKMEVINLINEFLYDNNIITKNMIFKSFKETGISINLNGVDKSLYTSFQGTKGDMIIRDPENLVYDEEINFNLCLKEEVEIENNIDSESG